MSTCLPRVTIGIPVYNGGSYFEPSLNCILDQTFTNLEVVIFDNGSTDQTEAVCRAYVARDSRIRYYRSEENLGAAYSQSRVVQLARGEYFRWTHADDLCAPTLIERCVEVLDANPAVMTCYVKTRYIDENGVELSEDPDSVVYPSPNPHLRFKHMLNCWRGHVMSNALFGLMRTAELQQTPLIANYPASDRNLLAEIALRGEFYEIPEYLFFRRDHPGRSMRANKTVAEVDSWFNPKNKGRRIPVRWVWLFEYLKSIRRVPMSPAEKARCYGLMLRWCTWNFKSLSAELVRVVPTMAISSLMQVLSFGS